MQVAVSLRNDREICRRAGQRAVAVGQALPKDIVRNALPAASRKTLSLGKIKSLPMRKLANTFSSWRFTRDEGIMEGFHGEMKVIHRHCPKIEKLTAESDHLMGTGDLDRSHPLPTWKIASNPIFGADPQNRGLQNSRRIREDVIRCNFGATFPYFSMPI
jgi:hypothetical protein